MFGLTGETLANRVSATARAAGLGDGFSGYSGCIGMTRRMVAAGAPTDAVQHQGHGSTVIWWPGIPGARPQARRGSG